LSLFKWLGILAALYTIYSVSRGEVFAKSGVWGRTVMRAESPHYFWTVIVIYSGLSLALVFLF